MCLSQVKPLQVPNWDALQCKECGTKFTSLELINDIKDYYFVHGKLPKLENPFNQPPSVPTGLATPMNAPAMKQEIEDARHQTVYWKNVADSLEKKILSYRRDLESYKAASLYAEQVTIITKIIQRLMQRDLPEEEFDTKFESAIQHLISLVDLIPDDTYTEEQYAQVYTKLRGWVLESVEWMLKGNVEFDIMPHTDSEDPPPTTAEWEDGPPSPTPEQIEQMSKALKDGAVVGKTGWIAWAEGEEASPLTFDTLTEMLKNESKYEELAKEKKNVHGKLGHMIIEED